VIVTFGPRAEAYARVLGNVDIEAIIADVEFLPRAYFAAVERRVNGRPFYGMILYEDSPSRFSMMNATNILNQVSGFDLQGTALNQLLRGTLGMPDGSTVADVWSTSQATVGELLREFCMLCDAILVRSQTEYARLNEHCVRPRPAEPVLAVPVVPAVTRRLPERPSVVIWAPERPSAQVAFQAFALQELHGDVSCVTSDGTSSAHLAARFITAADPAVDAALATASCILCVDPDDPGAAVAFAALGYGIAAPMTSGAHEFIRGVIPYDGRSLDGVYAAVVIAMGSPAAVRQLPPLPPPLPRRPMYPVALAALPIVSVVIPTYNRRQDLTRALACLSAQTYPRIEILVVNDAGEDVSDIVGATPGASYLTMPANGGVLKTEMMGIAAAAGEYIQLLADDDFLAPDHVEALVTAMLISGASMAHGNCLIRYQEAVSEGKYATVGYNASVFNDTVTASIALMATPISGNSIMIHRRVFETVGPYRDDCMLADQEMQMRALQRFAFVYVDRMTAEWRARGKENFSTTADSVPELRRMFEELHPQPQRPEIERRREETLERIANRPKGVFAFPPTIAFGPQAP
jgi:GT2 family glycosyltransferase